MRALVRSDSAARRVGELGAVAVCGAINDVASLRVHGVGQCLVHDPALPSPGGDFDPIPGVDLALHGRQVRFDR